MSISESAEISKKSDSPWERTPKSTLRHDWSERLQLEGRLSRLELEQEMTPFVEEATTEATGVIRMNTAKRTPNALSARSPFPFERYRNRVRIVIYRFLGMGVCGNHLSSTTSPTDLTQVHGTATWVLPSTIASGGSETKMWVQDQLLTSMTVSWTVPRRRPSGMITCLLYTSPSPRD